MRVWHLPLWLFIVLVSALAGCRSSDQTSRVAAEIQKATGGKPPASTAPAVWKDVKAFYEHRQFLPAWVEHKHVLDRSALALDAVRSANAHGFDAADYGEADIMAMHKALAESDKDAPDRMSRLAEFDLRVTRSLFALGRDVAVGRTTPDRISRLWKMQRPVPDLAGTLAEAIDQETIDRWLDRVKPRHPEYQALQKALASLEGQREKGGWPTVTAASGKNANAASVTLRQRLIASGELDGEDSADPARISEGAVTAALNAFRSLHAIPASGKLDAATLAALNVPIDRRIAQVRINMERWRWMPDALGERHFLVNIPYYHLLARERGKTVMDIRVVVGKPGNETPIFSDEMEVVVFSPYWNIPDSIVTGETGPAVARDPGYLARNNIEVLRVSGKGAQRVDPASVDWSDAGSLRSLAFRQRPGAQNALGHVKFLFPYSFDVYLHDTPADSLFERPGRAFSHGCVRVEEPEVLANYVLKGYDEWSDEAILKAMHAGVERQVKLEEKIPVHIAYFTAWVDDHGGLHFQPDIYGYDARQSDPGVRP